MKELLDRWVSPVGRLSQRGYVLTFALPVAALIGLTWLAFFGAPHVFRGAVMMSPIAIGWLMVIGVGDSLNIKRWHDTGNSGRIYRMLRPAVVLLPIVAVGLYLLAPMRAVTTGDIGALIALAERERAGLMAVAPMLVLAVTGAGVAANVLYLSVAPGNVGPNAYGPDPRGGVAVPGAKATAAAQGGDPVERALADYRKRMSGEAAVQARPPTGGGFGKKKR